MKTTTAMKPVQKILATLSFLFFAAVSVQAQTPTALDQLDQSAAEFINVSQGLEGVLYVCNSAGDVCCTNEAALNQILPQLVGIGSQLRTFAIACGGRLTPTGNMINAKMNAMGTRIAQMITSPANSNRFFNALDAATDDLSSARTIAEGIRVEIQSIRNGN